MRETGGNAGPVDEERAKHVDFVPGTFAVGILAAGISRRMGGNPKLCLPWSCVDAAGTKSEGTILAHLLETWRRLGASRIVVVHGAQDVALEGNALPAIDPVFAELNRLLATRPILQSIVVAIPTRHPLRDMMGSVQTVAAHMLESEASPAIPQHTLISLGDQPHLQDATLQRVVDAVRDPCNVSSVIRPRWNGRGGHPLGLPQCLLEELVLTDLPTLKHFLQLHHAAIVDVACDDPGLVLDIDTPHEYEILRKLSGEPLIHLHRQAISAASEISRSAS